jgi:hypothetical protein
MDPILDFFCKVDRIVKILQDKDDYSKQTNFYDNLNQIDDNIINADLNLSFRDIAMKTDDAVNYLLSSLPDNLKKALLENNSQPQATLDQLNSVNRRLLSNYVNNPENNKDRNGTSLVEKYGIRLLVCIDDGYVIHDVQTFTGNNNNYCVQFTNKIMSSALPQKIGNVDFSNLSQNARTLQQLQVIKCGSDVPPRSNENSKNEYKIFDDAKNVIEEESNKSFVKLQILDNHSTRTEVMQAKMAKYGLSARKSDTISNFNWYVARNVGNFVLRLSIFEK